jgi:hypothetical protein
MALIRANLPQFPQNSSLRGEAKTQNELKLANGIPVNADFELTRFCC